MAGLDPQAVSAVLREWLRSEQRLGVTHIGRPQPRAAPPPSTPAASAAPPAPEDADRASAAVPAAPPRRPTSAGGASSAASLLPGVAPRGPGDPRLPPLCDRELSVDEARAALATLEENYVRGCRMCGLCAHRTQTVFGVGHPRPSLVFVGEGPGAEEDAQGLPFVGAAGQLLTRMIAAMGLTREQVYIANVVKCRPPGNRTPTDEEMETCAPYLYRQLAILRPKVIVALGRPAAQTLLATKTPIGKLRGAFHDFPPPALAGLGLPPARLMPTFHPAYLLRSPGEKGKVWEDLQQVMAVLGLKRPGQR